MYSSMYCLRMSLFLILPRFLLSESFSARAWILWRVGGL